MATNTYVVIETQTLSASVATVTFNSIPQTYTDLVLVANCSAVTGGSGTGLYFNGVNTGTTYSSTELWGPNGSATYSQRNTDTSSIYCPTMGTAAGSHFLTANIFNYTNTTTHKTALIRSTDTTNGRLYAITGYSRSTSAITSVSFSSSNFAVGSTFTLYGIKANAETGTKALGGVVTSDATYVYHTFTNSGNFVPSTNLTADYLVIGGGGGGGIYVGGGGGAGGLRTSFTASTLSCTSGTNYTVLVGAGGAGSTSSAAKGSNGGNSVFSTISSTGGGGGGTYVSPGAGSSGGSGGGSSWYASNAPGSGNAGSYSPVEGYAGGYAATDSVTYRNGGGGGGAGGVGGNGSSSSYAAGVGGNGVANSITGTSITYAGGGGGCTNASSGAGGAGGTGGGGAGGNNSVATPAAGNGTMALGAGGGGGGLVGGNGGSGIVIIRYAK